MGAPDRFIPGAREGLRPFLIALIATGLVVASAAFGSGGLTSMGCIADPMHNPDGCGSTASGLDAVTNIAVSRDGTSAYATSAGDDAVVGFHRDTTTGELTPIGCVAPDTSSECSQDTTGLDYPSSVAVSPDGKSVYVGSAGLDSALVIFDRNPATGELTPAGCIGDDDFNPNGCGQTAKEIGGSLTPGVEDVVVSSDNKSVYVVSGESGIVHFRRDTTTGALTPQDCVADVGRNDDDCATTAKGLYVPRGVAVSRDGGSVYVTTQEDQSIVRFDRNTTSGSLTPKGCIGDRGHNPAHCGQTAKGLFRSYDVAVSRDGGSVYVAAGLAVTRFNRKATGALKPRGCIGDAGQNFDGCPRTTKGLQGGFGIAVAPDGTSVYAVAEEDNSVVRFNRNKATGALTPKGCIGDADSNPASCPKTAAGLNVAEKVAVSPDDASVYAAGGGDNAIVEFKRKR
jgi:DNA-binding beta-propeller fold protein YncE